MNFVLLYDKRRFGRTIPLASDDKVHSSLPMVHRNDLVRWIVIGNDLLAPNDSTENIFDVNINR